MGRGVDAWCSWARAEQPKLGGWSPQETCTKDRSRSDMYINEHSQRNPGGRRDGERHRFLSVLHRRGCINTECYIRMLDDVYLPHCMARLGTDTSSWWWQEEIAPSHTSRHTKAFLKEREIQLLTRPPCSPDLSQLDFHLWQEWETALGDRRILVPIGTARHDRAHSVSSPP